MKRYPSKLSTFVLTTALLAGTAIGTALACTRTLYVGADNTVITGRTMDWMEDMISNLWAFPAGMKRDGATGTNTVAWTSKYGSVVVSGYEVGTADGMNERGLVANMLYLAESDYGQPAAGQPTLSISLWAQYVLDNFATVAEAIDVLRREPFAILAPTLPNGAKSTLHLSISDATGDSAIVQYVNGKPVIFHGKQYVVMTNSPIYSEQLALNEYWKNIGGLVFLPGTNRASDRFTRASFLLGAIPKQVEPNFIKSVPGQAFAFQAVASVMSVMRAVSVPLGITTPGQPNIASTIWRTVADQKNKVFYFDSSTRPNTFWVTFDKIDLKPGVAAKKLTIQNGEVFSGEVAGDFKPAEPFKFLPATPN